MERGTIGWWDKLTEVEQVAIYNKWVKISRDMRKQFSLKEINTDEAAIEIMLREVKNSMFGFDFL